MGHSWSGSRPDICIILNYWAECDTHPPEYLRLELLPSVLRHLGRSQFHPPPVGDSTSPSHHLNSNYNNNNNSHAVGIRSQGEEGGEGAEHYGRGSSYLRN